MATKRLGKGLEALIRSDNSSNEEKVKHAGITKILLSKIKTNPVSYTHLRAHET